MTAKVINGREIAQKLRRQTRMEIEKLYTMHHQYPHIVTIKIGRDPSSELYLKLRNTACKEVGIKTTIAEYSPEISEQEILTSIQKFNEDPAVHGILIQFPVPRHLSSDKLISAIHPDKDVEGFNPINMGKTLIGVEQLVPCTPLAVLTILEHEHITLKGKDTVIVNHSNVVGKPLAALFLNRDATVSICHVFTKHLPQYTCKADILVTATGKPKLITERHIKKGAVVIDVGITPTKDGVCGDVHFDRVKAQAGRLTPVPGGVGPVTIACSLKNMITTFQLCMASQ